MKSRKIEFDEDPTSEKHLNGSSSVHNQAAYNVFKAETDDDDSVDVNNDKDETAGKRINGSSSVHNQVFKEETDDDDDNLEVDLFLQNFIAQ
eukprot:scaffold92594_cov45-Cyclotella_meneghiniana.AAC.1